MRALSALSDKEIAERLASMLGCPASRLASLKLIDEAGYRTVKEFWMLLCPAHRLLPALQQHDMSRGDMLSCLGALIHFGAGCEVGKLRVVAFRTAGAAYNVDSQYLRFFLLLYMFQWAPAVKEILMVFWRGCDPASHFAERTPILCAAISEVVEEAQVTDVHCRDFIERHALDLFHAYMDTFPYMRRYFDDSGTLLSERTAARRDAGQAAPVVGAKH